jgi:hypothetical protein
MSSSGPSDPDTGSGALGDFEIGVSPIGGHSGYTPAGSDILLEAFEMCDIHPNSITSEQFISGRRSMNFVIVAWANRGINLWKVEQLAFPLFKGEAQHPLDPGTIDVLDVYRRINLGGIQQDFMLYPLSRTNYAQIPNKLTQGPPTSFWFERAHSPQIHLWQVPEQDDHYTLVINAMYRQDDADPTMGRVVDVHYRFLPAYTAAVAAAISLKWAFARYQVLAGIAAALWQEASMEDREKVPTHIRPDFSPYFQY